MTNIATALKSEIARISKKTLKQDISFLRSANAQQRKQIASLKTQLTDVQRIVARLQKAQPSKVSAVSAGDDGDATPRFSAKGLRSHRQKLQLSAADYGRLVGASGLSVYKWEAEKAHPRKQQIKALAAVRGMGKREALARLSELPSAGA